MAGNWKMNKTKQEADSFFQGLAEFLQDKNLTCQLLISPAFPYLYSMKSFLGNQVLVSAQNIAAEKEGAFTGEVSGSMLASIGVDASLVGHSERREYYGEKNDILNKKINSCLDSNLMPVYCVGETLEERRKEQHFAVVKSQLKEALLGISKADMAKIVIAYEPVWAIGTGEVATPSQAEEMHLFIRNTINELYDASISDNIRILYGGSVKPSNVVELFTQPNVDGGLIGGASLLLDDYISIIEQTEKISNGSL